MNPSVSIIIPAYNAGKYIGECLESVNKQTFSDFEVIVINDGSTDDTSSIIRKAVETDTRIRLLDLKKNVGLSGARNVGIEESRADFLLFLDSDDCLYPQAVELLYKGTKGDPGRICRCGFKRGRHFKPVVYADHREVKFKIKEALKNALYQKIYLNSAWGMLISREIVKKAGAFRQGIWYEDLDSFYRFFELAESIIYIPEDLYFYRRNDGSFLGRWSVGRLDVLDVTDRMAAYVGRRYPDLEAAALDRRFSAHYNIYALMKRYGIANDEAKARCRRVIREGRFRALTDPEVRLKNKVGALLSYLFF